jgi:4-diphosphocytidyl-2-C-methyl-D-erythritol kinase
MINIANTGMLQVSLRPLRKGTDGDARRLFNVFEEVLPKKQAETVWEMKDLLIDSGALGAVMTGTGSGVFGIFSAEAAAEEAAVRLKAEGIECYTARTMDINKL